MNQETTSPEGKTQNITLGLVLCWVFGVLFLISGVGFIVTNMVAGAIVFLGGLIMLPPVNDAIRKQTNVNLSGGLRFIIAIILIAVGASLATSDAISTATSSTDSSGDSGASETRSPSIEIVDISTRVTESNSVWSKFAWNLILKNNTDRTRTVNAEIKWVDAEGFVVDNDYQYGLAIPAHEKKTFNDFQLIDASVSPNVEGIKAEIN